MTGFESTQNSKAMHMQSPNNCMGFRVYALIGPVLWICSQSFLARHMHRCQSCICIIFNVTGISSIRRGSPLLADVRGSFQHAVSMHVTDCRIRPQLILISEQAHCSDIILILAACDCTGHASNMHKKFCCIWAILGIASHQTKLQGQHHHPWLLIRDDGTVLW